MMDVGCGIRMSKKLMNWLTMSMTKGLLMLLLVCWGWLSEARAQVGAATEPVVRPVELTPADLEHGKRQVERMLADRLGMAVYRREKDDQAGYVEEGDAIYQWAVEAYAGKYVGERVYWEREEPSDGYAASHGRADMVGLNRVRVRNVTGSGREAFEKMWSGVVFEMHNMSLGAEWRAVYLGAMDGALSADEFAKGCAKVEWQAIHKMGKFRQEVWVPWAAAQGLKHDEDVWRWRDQEDFEKWLAHYQDPEDYPWKHYRENYDHMRQWADYYRERFKVFAPMLPGR